VATFSERQGIVNPRRAAQVGAMDDALRNGIWNAVVELVFQRDGFLFRPGGYGGAGRIDYWSFGFWAQFLKKPADTRPGHPPDILTAIRDVYFALPWHGVYDFVEFALRIARGERRDLEAAFQAQLAAELSGYRIIGGAVVPIADEQEVALLEQAIEDRRFAGCAAHLKRALELMSDRNKPDYRNSIKESISAVESLAREITKKPRAMLPDALGELERNGKLHKALKQGFINSTATRATRMASDTRCKRIPTSLLRTRDSFSCPVRPSPIT
jgi:hypothetical protein